MKYPSTLLGIVGESGSGKDHVANRFCDLQNTLYSKELVTIAFADKIRQFIEIINPQIISYVTIKDLLKHNTWDDLKKPNFVFPFFSLAEFKRKEIVENIRILMQNYGEAGRQIFHPDHWIDLILPKPDFSFSWEWNRWESHPPNYLIKDLRRENEAKRIKLLGGYIIRVDNPYRSKAGAWRSHITETEQVNIKEDYLVNNYMSFLDIQISKILEDIGEKCK